MPRLSDYADLLGEETIRAWPAVANAVPEGSSLMGGTGLAIWLRHRRSADLDIFSPVRLDPARIVASLSEAGDFVHVEASERIVRGTFNAVNVDIIFEDGVFTLAPPRELDGLLVASLQDIAAGKFNALVGRKQIRDFIDIMCIETMGNIRLEQGVMLYFRRNGINLHPAEVRTTLQHLVDFRHLDDDPAMVEAFGEDIRYRVESYFRSRQPEVAAALQHLLADPS